MTSKRKSFGIVAYAALTLLAAGCSGINASHSVSPATFFLPGLLKADPPAGRQLPEPGKMPAPTAPDDLPLFKPSFVQQVALVR